MILHLAASTLVLGITIAAAYALPLRARTRCTLLLLGIAQFFVPAVPPRFLGFGREEGPAIIRIIAAPLNSAATSASPAHVNWLAIVWAIVAAAIVVRVVVAHGRVAMLIRRAQPATQRDHDALARTLAAIANGPQHDVCATPELLRTSEVDTPALAGLVRPRILLPDYVDGLDEHEVDALLLHECAHLARRDNVIAAVESVAAALLWFHPLVWLARRAIAVAREEACDEMVVALTGTEPYLHALGKVCRAAIAPRAATLSCMASNRLTERIRYMNELSRLRSLSPAVVFTSATLLIAASAVATGVAGGVKGGIAGGVHGGITGGVAGGIEGGVKGGVKEGTGGGGGATSRGYALKTSMTKVGSDTVRFDITVTDASTGEVLAQPQVTTQYGVPAEVHTGMQDAQGHARDLYVSVVTKDGSEANVTMKVEQDGIVTQRSTTRVVTRQSSAEATDNNISLQLKDADLRDVLHTLGKLTNKQVVIENGVDAVVTLDVRDTPWTEVLQIIAKQSGVTATVDGDTIRVTR